MLEPTSAERSSRALLDGYDPSGFFDEMFEADGSARPHHGELFGHLSSPRRS